MACPTIIEKLRTAPIPEVYSRQSLNEFLAQGSFSLADRPPFPEETKQLIAHPEVDSLIDRRELTVAMIKPNLQESTVRDKIPPEITSDADIAVYLLGFIKSPLERVVTVSTVMSNDDVAEFYAEPRLNMETKPPVRVSHKVPQRTRWDEWQKLMTSGASTFSLLWAETDAVTTWRIAMGTSWDVEKLRKTEPESLRARFARDNYNNIFHGSDSPESVRRELEWLVEKLRNL